MAQVAHSDCNTSNKSSSRVRSRNWCFTLNNYTEEDINSLKTDDYEYVFQEETGEQGTKHLQGLICFKNPMSLSSLKKINNKAHWEKCKNKKASIKYCTKEDTRTGNIYSNIKLAQGTEKNQIKKFSTPPMEWYEKEIEELMKENNFDYEKITGRRDIYHGPREPAPPCEEKKSNIIVDKEWENTIEWLKYLQRRKKLDEEWLKNNIPGEDSE